MKLRSHFVAPAVLLMLALPICLHGQRMPERISLTDGWKFRTIEANAHAEAAAWHAATVPGEVQTDLLAAHLIPDPFFADNEKQVQWVGEQDWEYRKTLQLDPKLEAAEHLELIFEGLDTFADVSVNGKPLFSANNMFRTWRVDVRPLLHAGANELCVIFHSPYKVMTPVIARLPYILPGTGYEPYDPAKGVYPIGHYIRTAGYAYGWDWGPKLVTMGIWRPVSLEAWSGARIQQMHVEQSSVTAEQADLNADFDVKATRAAQAEVSVSFYDDQGHLAARRAMQTQLAAGNNHLRTPIIIRHPQRWFPSGYGPQSRYRVVVEVQQAGKPLDRIEKMLGLRSVELQRKPDSWGKSFAFVINEVPVFAKGANVIPMDSFPARVTEQRERALLTAARDANMNMIRLWGGGYYQTDSFYSIADELGLMVWQDFAFGGGMVPGDKEFQENVRAEASEQVRRLRDHASVVLWCGNNEVETAWDTWDDRQEFRKTVTPEQRNQAWKDYTTIFRAILPAVVKSEGGGVPYWSSSPSADFEEPANSSGNGDMHFWNIWSGKAPIAKYADVKTRFLSEYGFQGMPDPATVRAFAGSEERLDAPALANHERFIHGYERISEYMQQELGAPKDFASFNYLSQFMQAEAIRLAAEHLRASMPETMGSLYWQLNDCWPVVSWASIDYSGRPKALQYYARRFYAPLLIAADYRNGKVEIHLVSDLQQETGGQLRVRVMDFAGQILYSKEINVQAVPLASTALEPIDVAAIADLDGKRDLVLLEWWKDGKLLSRNQLYFARVKDSALPQPKLQATITKDGEGYYRARLVSDVAARAVAMSFSGLDVKLEDNFIDLLPGESVNVRIASRAPLEELQKSIRVTSVAQALGKQQ